jgi:lysylphosphatidylglycerol synthetase-like protein (DUF2156 family)
LRRRDWQWVSIRITSTPASTTLSVVVLSVIVVVALGTVLLVRSTVIEARDVDSAGITTSILGQAVGMSFELMSLQIHFRVEDDKLLLQALLIRADEMVFSEMHLEGVVIDIVLRVSATIAAITQVAAFVAVTAMREQFIIAVEALTTETTLGMTLETRLILGARDVVSMLFVPTQVLDGEEIVFMGKDLFVAGAEIAHLFVVDTLDVTVQIWPA